MKEMDELFRSCNGLNHPSSGGEGPFGKGRFGTELTLGVIINSR